MVCFQPASASGRVVCVMVVSVGRAPPGPGTAAWLEHAIAIDDFYHHLSVWPADRYPEPSACGLCSQVGGSGIPLRPPGVLLYRPGMESPISFEHLANGAKDFARLALRDQPGPGPAQFVSACRHRPFRE